jgi:integrase/recombinase XerD
MEMGIGKQAKTVSSKQALIICDYLSRTRNPKRDIVIFLFSVKAGLRAKEIALLTWEMLLTPEGELGDRIAITNQASKGKSGREIPLNSKLRNALHELLELEKSKSNFLPNQRVIQTQRSNKTSPQIIINMFSRWYKDLGLIGCSSHSGRRTFISNAARKISTVGGSLRDVQLLAGHANLQTTQVYIDFDIDSHRKVVELI